MSNKLSKISLIFYTLRFSPLSYEEKLKKVSEIGYQSVQGGVMPNMTNAEHKALLDKYGLEVSALAGGLEDVIANPGKYIDACEVFDTRDVMIGTMPTECRADYDGYMRAIDMINKAGHELFKGGCYISYHNHAQEFRKFSNGKRGIDLLYENLDYKNGARFLPDTHWIHSGGGDVIEWIKKFEGRMEYLHVKDYTIAPANYLTGIGETEKRFAPIGGGNLPWQLIVDTALACGVKAFIVEQDFTYGEDPFDCVALSYKTLKSCGL